MAVNFREDEVNVECDICGVFLIGLSKKNLTVQEAVDFANRYRGSIFCKKCDTIPEKIPENETLH